MAHYGAEQKAQRSSVCIKNSAHLHSGHSAWFVSHCALCYFQCALPPATCGPVRAQLQEVLAKYPMNTRFASIEVTGQYRVALINLEAEQLPQEDCAAHRSLEALRLEDPATMSGCWNPGCENPGCP